MTAAIARRAPRSPATKVAACVPMARALLSTRRPRRAWRREPRARAAASFGFFALWLRGVWARRQMDAKPLDPPPVGFEDFKLDSALVANALAPRRDTAGNGKGETAQRVDVLLLFVRNQRE